MWPSFVQDLGRKIPEGYFQVCFCFLKRKIPSTILSNPFISSGYMSNAIDWRAQRHQILLVRKKKLDYRKLVGEAWCTPPKCATFLENPKHPTFPILRLFWCLYFVHILKFNHTVLGKCYPEPRRCYLDGSFVKSGHLEPGRVWRLKTEAHSLFGFQKKRRAYVLALLSILHRIEPI